jgi:GNAT superfamily N-acetyltransferase
MYELAAYEPAHREQYLRLLREAWGDAAMSGAEFDWWFGRNPAGSLMSVARTDGRIVGVAAHSLARMQLDGQDRLASFSVHATTDASARGQGIFPALERRHEEEAQERGAAVVLAFASKPTEPIFLGALGWTDVGRLRIWARLFPRLRGTRTRVDRVERFTHDGDAASSWPNHVVRDARHLNWRYAESPKGYELFESDAGYAVLGHKLHRGQPIALVADLVASDARPLLRACLAATRAGARALFALPAAHERRAYASLGFTPTPLALRFMGKPLAGTLAPTPHSWRFTLGDTDFF